MLRGFGAEVSVNGKTIVIEGNQNLTGRDIRIPGDISSAAFFLAAAATISDSDIVIRNVGCNPTRDGVIEVLRRMGASIQLDNERVVTGDQVEDVRVVGGSLKGVDVGADYESLTYDVC